MTKEEAIDQWTDAQMNWGCSCHLSPPCSFCVDGFSLDLDEYLELHYYEDEGEEQQDETNAAYERAMGILG